LQPSAGSANEAVREGLHPRVSPSWQAGIAPRHAPLIQVTNMISRRYFTLLTASVLLAAGCGGGGDSAMYPSARLEGAVLLDGQKIDGGSIQFHPAEGQPGDVIQAPILQGRYVAPYVARGKVKVIITMPSATPPETVTSDYVPPKTLALPDRYKSGIPIEVKDDNPNQDFDLTSRQ
jgi:hypothetical protein